jgi:hypothetical protein
MITKKKVSVSEKNFGSDIDTDTKIGSWFRLYTNQDSKLLAPIMAIWVVEFSSGVYKFRKIFA